VIELKDVSKYYHNDGVTNRGLNNINLKFERNEIVVITGESGSGKSTLLNVITKQDTFDEGEIYYFGNETSYFSIDDMDHFRKNKIGFIFQNYNIIDSYTVLENVMLPLIINGVSYNEAKKEALEIIDKVGLTEWKNNRGTKLSGGQKQRCVIARALASKCEILACDEPTGNLDSETGREIVELIKEVSKDKLVLIVTHNYDQFKDIATRKLKVHDGEIIEDIYLNKPELDSNMELDLDYIPVSRKTDTRIAFNNLKSTPKKTFFMCIITLITAFFIFFFYQLVFSSMNSMYKENPFNYEGNNKIIVYNSDNSKIDISKMVSKGFTVESNLIYEDEDFTFYFDVSEKPNFDEYSSYFSDNFGYEPHFKESDLKIVEGKMPKADNEIMLIYPSNNYESHTYLSSWDESEEYYLKPYFNFYKGLDNYNYYNELVYKVVGRAKSSKISSPIVITNGSWENNEVFKIYSHAYQSMDFSSDTRIVIDYSEKTLFIKSDSKYDTFPLADFKITPKNYVYHDMPIETYDGDYIRGGILIIGSDISEYEDVYQASVYGNKESIKKEAKKEGLSYFNISKYDSSNKLTRFLANLSIYLSIAGLSMIILILYFIASIILLKVFSSKLESYAIFRTLGVTKKDMKKILYVEVFMTVISMTILNLFISISFRFITINNFFFNTYDKLSLKIIIIYLLMMTLIASLLAKKFNKKLFKSSVSKTLREED